MKSYKQLKWDLGEAKKQAVEAIDRSATVMVRPADLRHKTPGVTVMVRKHKKHKRGKRLTIGHYESLTATVTIMGR